MTIKDYTPGDHYNPTCGYRAKEIALDAGRRAAQVIDKMFDPYESPDPVRLVVIDRSTATLAVATSFFSLGTQLEMWNYKCFSEPGCGHGLAKPPPRDCRMVLVDDYYNCGRTLKAAFRSLGRKLDLAIYITTAAEFRDGAWREYAERAVDLSLQPTTGGPA